MTKKPAEKERSIKDITEIRMTLGEHLEELRSRLIRGLLGPVIGVALCMVYGNEIIVFLWEPMRWVLENFGLPTEFHFMNAMSAFLAYLKVSLVGGLILGMPWLSWQMWKFIEAGLYKHERKFIYLLVPGSAFLTLMGLLFLYYILLPVTLTYLIGFSQDFPSPGDRKAPGFVDYLIKKMMSDNNFMKVEIPEGVTTGGAAFPLLAKDPEKPVAGQVWINLAENKLKIYVDEKRIVELRADNPRKGAAALDLRLDDYINFVVFMGLALVVGFQLPLVMLMLAVVGLVDRKQMSGIRKYAIVGCVTVAAVVTPTGDPLTLAMLAVPLYVLYELGLLLVLFISRQRQAVDEAASKES